MARNRALLATEARLLPIILTTTLLAAPVAADAQPAGKVYRIGYLAAGWGSGTAYLVPSVPPRGRPAPESFRGSSIGISRPRPWCSCSPRFEW